VTVRALTNVDRVIDTYTVITDAFADWLAANKFTAVGRYLDNLSLAEIARLHQRNIGVFGIRTARRNGWLPTGVMGKADGLETVQLANDLGFEDGTSISCDFEGCAPTTAASDAIAYGSEWPALVTSRWKAMFYEGAEQPLNGTQLYMLPGFTLYWRSCSIVPSLQCGYVLAQTRPGNVLIGPAGGQVLVDIDQPETDLHFPARSVTAMFP
jgi:hypothetical protein